MGTPSKKVSMLPSVENLLTSVNDPSTSGSNCYRALVSIREHISNSQFLSDFLSSDGIKAIITQLKKPNKKLVDVSLSILGHCVVNSSEPRIQFRSEGGLPVLVQVLKNFEDVNSIQQRACRAIGSLAQEKRNISKMLDLYVFVQLGLIVIRSTDDETLSMCIRAVHKLSDTKQHVALLGRNFTFHRLVSLLIKSDSTRVIKQLFSFFAHLWENYLKLFSETSSHYWIGSQDGGKLVQKLVDLRQHSEPAIATKAPKLLQQLIQNAHVRSTLASIAAFEALIPLVKEENKVSRKSTVFTTSLLLLCREGSHLFTEAGGIGLLIDLIRDSDPSSDFTHLHSQHSVIFSTLISFKDDTCSLTKLVDAGIIDLLTAKIAKYTELCKSDTLDQEDGLLTSKFCEHDEYQSSSEHLQDDQMDSALSTPKSCCHPGCKVRCQRKRQYRTTSPSYQAVEMEYSMLSRFREYAAKHSEEPVLNIFGYRLYSDNQDCHSPSSSPQHSTGGSIEDSVSPNHSSGNWSDYDEDLDEPSGENEWSYAASPVYSDNSSEGSPSTEINSAFSPSTPLFSSNDFEDEEDGTVCYSPAVNDLEIELSPFEHPHQLSCNKKRKYDYDKHLASEKRMCCETDLKILWLRLGCVGGKDFHENWPEFSAEPHQIQQQVALYILHKISWLQDTPNELAGPKCIKTLIEYLILTPRPTFRACQILFRIASCPSLFVNLLKNKFPLDIFASFNSRVTSNQCCPLHNTLFRVGQQILDQLSEIVLKFGQGEMEYIMTNEKVAHDLESIKIVAMTTPVIVKSRHLLRRYVKDLNVLDIISSLLSSAETIEYATISLTSLGVLLNMEDFLISRDADDIEDLYDRNPCQVLDELEDVQFEIHPDITVGAIKDRLQESNFFQAMFRGGFKESTSVKVKLADIDAPVLRIILHTEYGCGTGCDVIQSLNRLIQSGWKSALNLLQNFDRFLLLDKIDGVRSLIVNQDWIRCPSSFVSLWHSISPDFEFSLKLRNHLQYFPFSNAAQLNCRVKVVEAVLQSQAAEESVRFWKEMFLQRIEDN